MKLSATVVALAGFERFVRVVLISFPEAGFSRSQRNLQVSVVRVE